MNIHFVDKRYCELVNDRMQAESSCKHQVSSSSNIEASVIVVILFIAQKPEPHGVIIDAKILEALVILFIFYLYLIIEI